MSVNAIGGGQTVRGAHHHGGGGAHRAGMDAAAQALGMSGDDLRSALKGGATLSSLAQSKGISTDDLTRAIGAAVSKANPSMSADRAQQLAQRLVAGPPGGGPHPGLPLAGGDPDGDRR